MKIEPSQQHLPTSPMLDPVEAQLLDRVRALSTELHSLRKELYNIKRSRSYRIKNRVLRSRYGKMIRWIGSVLIPEKGGLLRAIVKHDSQGPAAPIMNRIRSLALLLPNHIGIQPTGKHYAASAGNEAWLLAVKMAGSQSFDMRRIHIAGTWEFRPSTTTPSGVCLVNRGSGRAIIPAGPGARLIFMTHPWSGIVEVIWQGRRITVDLYSREGGTLQIVPSTGEVRAGPPWLEVSGQTDRNATISNHATNVRREEPFTREERDWIERMAEDPQPVAVVHPAWRGIRSSTTQLFNELYDIDDNLDEARGLHYARLFAEAGCRAVIIQGFPLTYRYLVSSLRQVRSDLPIYVIWHGSFLQAREDYAWTAFRAVEQLCRNGAIYKWGFVKKGMAEIMATRRLHTGFVMNMVRHIPEVASTPLPNGLHLGMWSIFPSWHKLPYEMLAATLMLERTTVHASGVDARTKEFADLLGLRAEMSTEAIDRRLMPQKLAQMHLNLYVTLNECAPMLPLESLAAGAPCLLGPNSPYFEDHEYLHRRMVVPVPDSAAMIATYARAALEERTEIIDAYRSYAPSYNAQAQANLETFLEMPYRIKVKP